MENKFHITDEELLAEFKRRLDEKNSALQMQNTLIAELEDLNVKLRNTEQVKSGFLSNIRNEVNNPLTSIIGLSEQLMSGRIQDEEKRRSLASVINREAFALDFQMRNIFAAAELEAGELVPQAAHVDVHELVRLQLAYFSQKSVLHEVSLSSTHISDEKFFTTDAGMLQLVVMNLISNAITFSSPGGKVIVQTEVSNGKLTITVLDFGKGISDKELKHVFERFHQLESGTTKHHQGHGLGLAIVKDIVDSLRGQLDIQSVKSEWTTVRVVFPQWSEGNAPEGLSSGNEVLFSDSELF